MGRSVLIYLLINFTFTRAIPLRRGFGNGFSPDMKLVEGKEKLPILDDEFEERCAAVRRDCIQTGEIFRRNIVCSSNFKRYLNMCHLQLRSCDLHRDIGELLPVERCWWIKVPDDIVVATTILPKRTTPQLRKEAATTTISPKGTTLQLREEATTNEIIIDHTSNKRDTSTQTLTTTTSTGDFYDYSSYSYAIGRGDIVY